MKRKSSAWPSRGSFVQTVESYVILPIVMRQAVSIPPIVTLGTVVLWGRLLGPLGLILALPLDLAIWTAVEHFRIAADASSSEGGSPSHSLASTRRTSGVGRDAHAP